MRKKSGVRPTIHSFQPNTVQLLVVVGVLTLAVAIFWIASRSPAPRNFRVVEDGKLYRSGQLTPGEFEQVVRDCHIRTIVTLRPVRDGAKSDVWEEDVCRARGLRHIRISPRDKGPGESGEVTLAAVVREFLEVMDDPANYPVLVHCMAGRDRTGTVCAVYRMEYDGWSADRVLDEMQTFGFDPNKDAAARAYEDFIRAYRPRRTRTN